MRRKYILSFSLILVLAASASGTYVPYAPQNFNDELFWLYDNGDATKRLQFELDAITTGNTRTIVIGDADGNTADWNAGYTHSQDNSQAHTDYLINNGNDSTTGRITADGGLTVGDHILAGTGNSYNLGASGSRFAILFAQTLNLSSAVASDLSPSSDGFFSLGTTVGPLRWAGLYLTDTAVISDGTNSVTVGNIDDAHDWGDHASGGYLKADGSVTVTGEMTHNVGADTTYISLTPGAGNYAIIDSNGELAISATNFLEVAAGAGADMLFDAGGSFVFRDTDASYAQRMIIDSATGDLGMTGTLTGCTQLTVDDIDLNLRTITFANDNAFLIGAGDISVLTDGDVDDFITFKIVNAHVPRITTDGGCNLEIFADGGNILTSNENLTGTGDLSYDELTLTNGQDYKFSRRSTNFMTLQSQSSGTANGFEFFSKDGDSSDDVTMTYWLLGTPGSVGNSEYCQIKFDASDDEFRMFTESVGTGTARTMAFYAENGNYHQLDLEADGDVKSLTSYTNTVGGTNHALFIDNTGKIGEEPSALRFKENIRPIEHSERIYQMEPVTYDRKDGTAYDQVGLIAEEVAVIWPELAIYKTERILEERPDEIDPNTTDNYLVGYREMDILSGIRSERLIFPLIEEMKKLRARVEVLEAKVEALEKLK